MLFSLISFGCCAGMQEMIRGATGKKDPNFVGNCTFRGIFFYRSALPQVPFAVVSATSTGSAVHALFLPRSRLTRVCKLPEFLVGLNNFGASQIINQIISAFLKYFFHFPIIFTSEALYFRVVYIS
ncbi:hypothetical protein [Burkholderia ubonensis]|uniref:hypothetical protein n=1 Tax=Burkholderia ubonensis TaxID=101571 RepID=UPI0012FA1B08|nr:hypothetical protein [Burkholderia ubonensis]